MKNLSIYHYGFREYPVRDSFRSDPEIGRWNRVDPLYYQTPGQSPYNFVSNNPVNSYDVMGLVTNTELKAFFTLKFAGWGAEFSHAPDYSEVESYGGVIGSGGGTGEYPSDKELRILLEQAWIRGDIIDNSTYAVTFYNGELIISLYGHYKFGITEPLDQVKWFQTDDVYGLEIIGDPWLIDSYTLYQYFKQNQLAYLPSEGVGINGSYYIEGAISYNSKRNTIHITVSGHTNAINFGEVEFYGNVELIDGKKIIQEQFQNISESSITSKDILPIGEASFSIGKLNLFKIKFRINVGYIFSSPETNVYTPLPPQLHKIIKFKLN
ncbi:RHS repeat-associated core domain-containing protein [Calditrichota bacterium GD2]